MRKLRKGESYALNKETKKTDLLRSNKQLIIAKGKEVINGR